MSGIAGQISLNKGKINPKILDEMRNRLSKRGPDGFKLLNQENVGFVNTELHSTSELTLEDNLLFFPHLDIFINSDARLDNREDLLNELSLDNHFSDNYIIASAYKKWGINCLNKFVGAFAFVIFDKKANKIFCARDQVGLKPLYYHYKNNKFTFASEIKGIFSDPEIMPTMNRDRVIDYLIFLHGKKGSSFFKDIYKVPKSNFILIEKDKIKLEQYFDFDYENQLEFVNDEEYADSFLSLFLDVTKSHLRSSNNKVSCALSGGLDSSAITCLAASIENDSQIYASSAIFKNLSENDKKKVDETIYMDSVIDKTGLKHNQVEINRYGPLEFLEEINEYSDEPQSLVNGYIHNKIFENLRKNDIKVHLDGIDGDTVISHGYEKLEYLGRNLRLLSLFREDKELHKNLGLSFSLKSSIKRNVIRPLIPRHLLWTYQNLFSSNQPLSWSKRLSEEVMNDIPLKQRLMDVYETNPFSYSRDPRYGHYLSLIHPTWESGIELMDIFSNKQGVEIRFPFFDIRLMQFCISMSMDQKLKNGESRYILRNSTKKIMPTKVNRRFSKGDLSPVADNQMGSLSPGYKQYLLEESKSISNLLNKDFMKNLLSNNRKKGKNTETVQIYTVVALEKWMTKNNFIW